MPKPTAQKATAVRLASMKFSSSALTALVWRINPVSSIAKPHCMKKTRKPVTKTQVVSTADWVAIGTASCACAECVPNTERIIAATAIASSRGSNRLRFLMLPPKVEVWFDGGQCTGFEKNASIELFTNFFIAFCGEWIKDFCKKHSVNSEGSFAGDKRQISEE